MAVERTPSNRSRYSKHSSQHAPSGESRPTQAEAQSANNAGVNGGGDGSGGDDGAPDPLSGHLNHLSPEQEEALAAFKAECIERKLYTPAEEGKGASHDEVTMLYVVVSLFFFLFLSSLV